MWSFRRHLWSLCHPWFRTRAKPYCSTQPPHRTEIQQNRQNNGLTAHYAAKPLFCRFCVICYGVCCAYSIHRKSLLRYSWKPVQLLVQSDTSVSEFTSSMSFSKYCFVWYDDVSHGWCQIEMAVVQRKYTPTTMYTDWLSWMCDTLKEVPRCSYRFIQTCWFFRF